MFNIINTTTKQRKKLKMVQFFLLVAGYFCTAIGFGGNILPLMLIGGILYAVVLTLTHMLYDQIVIPGRWIEDAQQKKIDELREEVGHLRRSIAIRDGWYSRRDLYREMEE